MIRRATLDDVAGLRSTMIAAYDPFAQAGISLPPVSEGLDDDIRDHHVWVAVDQGIVVGGIVLVLRDGAAYVANLAVHPDAKGQGLGRKLIETATTAAQSAGYATISLSTHREMLATQTFYTRLGWQRVGQHGDKVTFTFDLTE